MRNKLSLLLGCLTLVLFGLFTTPVQAEDNSPTQVFVDQADLSFDQAVPSAVLLLNAPLPILSPQSILEVPGDVGSIATGNFDADWPPGSTTAQAINFDNLLRCGYHENYGYTNLNWQSNQNSCYNTTLTGIDIDRSCGLNQDVTPLVTSTANQTTRHVLMC